MYDQFVLNLKIEDESINNNKKFIKQLISQRKLEIEFKLINKEDNLAKRIFEEN